MQREKPAELKEKKNLDFVKLQNQKLRRNCIFRHLETWRINWDLVVIMFAVYNSIQLPLDIAFKPSIFQSALSKFFDNINDLSFAIDIIISFRTTFVNEYTGDEEINGSVIFKNYLFGRFTIDLLATLPFDKMIKSETLNIKMIACLKLIRILRLGRLIKYLNSSEDLKQQILIFKLIFLLLLYLHFTGCMWYFVCLQSGAMWVPTQFHDYAEAFDIVLDQDN